MTHPCTTHHHACDCREAMHREQLAAARAEVERLRAALENADEALRHVAGYGFEHPDHHADECPGDCDDHTTAWIVETAIGKTRAALATEPRAQEEG